MKITIERTDTGLLRATSQEAGIHVVGHTMQQIRQNAVWQAQEIAAAAFDLAAVQAKDAPNDT
ncbi:MULTISPECIES: hypothetical protein [unclassified Mameliella]|uniref:hypothetical protein n=1 Tax=unclassified Mameliella TaxID=2630630 RepID=UPI00273FC369|nr:MULTISPECIES: hypothetical protein [unclassified Mameliella]